MATPISTTGRWITVTCAGSEMKGVAGRAGRRFVSSLPALFGVLVFTFLLMRVLPGDPAIFFASGPNAGQAEIEDIRRRMGLDKPVPEQLLL